MGRGRKGRPVHGWLVLDKPAGMSANKAVGAVKRLYNAQKAGHAGTLDPLATGVLPVALGEATKTVSFVMEGLKEYRFAVRWGAATATDDAEGEVVAESGARPDDAAIAAALPAFTGEIMQRPPAFSAVKVEGERAYKLARRDEAPELAPRPVHVAAFEHLASPDPDHAEFRVLCGKGTYIRSLARDLAGRLGTLGHVAWLRRTAVGPFAEKDAISLEKLELVGHSPGANTGDLLDYLLPVETALDDIPALALTESEAGRLKSGQPVPVLRTANRERVESLADGDMVSTMCGGKLIALTRLEGRQVFPVRVFNL